MKILKRVLCFLIVLPIMTLCVACKDDDSNGENMPPAQLSTAQILKTASEKFIESAGTGENDLGYVDAGVYAFAEYDEYLYISAKMLESISNVSNIQNNIWTSAESQILEGKDSYANKVSKFKLNQTELDGQVKIEIDMLFEISNLPLSTNNKSFDLWHYEVEYNRASEAVWIDALIEKSRNYEDANLEQNSNAKYIKIEFEEEKLIAISFDRTAEIADIENELLFNENVIENYSYLRFNFENKSYIDETSFAVNAIYGNAQTQVKEFVDIEQQVMTATTTAVHSALTSAVITCANAENIADIL